MSGRCTLSVRSRSTKLGNVRSLARSNSARSISISSDCALAMCCSLLWVTSARIFRAFAAVALSPATAPRDSCSFSTSFTATSRSATCDMICWFWEAICAVFF